MEILLSLSTNNEYVKRSDGLVSLSDAMDEETEKDDTSKELDEAAKAAADAKFKQEEEDEKQEKEKKEKEEKETEYWSTIGKKSLKEYGESRKAGEDEVADNLANPFDGGAPKGSSRVTKKVRRGMGMSALKNAVRKTPTSHTPTNAYDR